MRRTFFLLAPAIVAVWVGLFVHMHWISLPSLSAISTRAQSAAVFFVESITINSLHSTYKGQPIATATSSSPKVHILIVPGHEPDFGGTAFADYTERDIAVDIANDLATLLAKNPHLDVMVARDKSAWNSTLAAYFTEHETDIIAFRNQQVALMNQYLVDGRILQEGDEQVHHNDAPAITSLHLYGVNKWASENNVGITLHLHINDYTGRRWDAQGDYPGFAIYVPNKQYSNAKASRAIAESVAARLNMYHATSTMPKETNGVIEDQELIAIGSNNSADAASILIEYGYIYERQFQDAATRALAESDYAYATYLGLQDFFLDPVPSLYGTNVLPREWSAAGGVGTNSPDIYVMQTALHYLGLYPPPGRSFSDCPISGFFGGCTIAEMDFLQRSRGLPATHLLDAATQQAVSELFSH